MGIISALIAIPSNLIIVILFSKRRIRQRKLRDGEISNTTAKYVVIEEKNKTPVAKVEKDEDDDEADEEDTRKYPSYNYFS